MDGSFYDLRSALPPPHRAPWWRRRVETGSGVILMLAISVVTFGTLVVLDRAGIPIPGTSATVTSIPVE